MRPKLAVILIALLACDTADAPREVRSPTAPATGNMAVSLRPDGGGPAIEILIPVYNALTPALVPPVTTYEWGTVDGMESPDSVRWILEAAEDGFAETVHYLRNNFDDAAWSPWHPYDPDNDVGTSWTTPPIAFGQYVFAVHGKTGGEIDQMLDEQVNVRRIRVSQRSTGPLLTLTSNVHEPIVTAVVNTPVTIMNVPAGIPLEFCWTADATAYGGIVTSHRYGWDIIDPGDPEAWDVVSEYDGSEFCLAPKTFYAGTHTFLVEAVDNSDYPSQIPVRINVVDPPEPIALDVRPGACPNPVNPKSRGVVTVALPGSNDLDVNDVELSSLALGQFPDFRELATAVHTMVHDVTSPANPCNCSERAADGIDDLILKFSLRDLEIDLSGGPDVQLALVGRTTSGAPFVAVDCVRIVGFKDEGEPEPTGPDTRLLQVWSSYSVDGQWITEQVNTSDAAADTVPHGSWLTLYYDGIPDPSTESLCSDPVNQCLGYQKAYDRESPYFPGSFATSGWLPRGDIEDNSPLVRADSSSLNMGTLDYVVKVRAVDTFGAVDQSPLEVPIVANYQPTLTQVAVENYDGTGPDISWDWWNPSNFHGGFADTLDITDPPNIWVVREFYFLVKGQGHDHPKERDHGGIKAWRYFVEQADDPSKLLPLGRSGAWITGYQTNTLCDTVRFTVRYSLIDDPGGWDAWAALPDWIGRDYDVRLRGRDTAVDEPDFQQFVFVNGNKVLINEYPAGQLGRQTDEGTTRMHISLTRHDLPATVTRSPRPGLSLR